MTCTTQETDLTNLVAFDATSRQRETAMRFIEFLWRHGRQLLKAQLNGCDDMERGRSVCLAKAAHGFSKEDQAFSHELCRVRLMLLASYGIDPMQLVIERAIAAERAKQVVLGPEFMQQIIDGHEAVDDDEPTDPPVNEAVDPDDHSFF